MKKIDLQFITVIPSNAWNVICGLWAEGSFNFKKELMKQIMNERTHLMNMPASWNRESAEIFWGEIAPSDHLLQVYDNDDVFINSLAGFVGAGIKTGDCVLVIATTAHLSLLHQKLIADGISIPALIADDRYLPLDAETTLSNFMRNGWPDEELFNQTVSFLIEKANQRSRRVRAFGEMVALLWEKGYHGATVQLEHLWNKFREKNNFSLFCAYPKAGFTGNIQESINTICSCHSKLIDGKENHLPEVIYAETLQKAG